MAKIDLKKTHKNLYVQKPGIISEADVPPLRYLMIDGEGDPNAAPEFAEKVGQLFGVAYTMKFAVKKTDAAKDYGVAPLEGLWWCGDMSTFSIERKNEWKWTLMILQPDFITAADVNSAIAVFAERKKLRFLPALRFEELCESTCIQALHTGPYSEETELIKSMHAYIGNKGWKPAGKHHEIYLSDPRKTAPAKMKTILRQPYEK